MRYAVRGEIVKRADAIQHAIEEHPDQLVSPKFDHVLFTNLGNPHSVGQRSLTWPREVMALCNLPDEVGIDNPDATKIFPQDVIDRAREIKQHALHNHGTGAYSHSQGAMPFREDIAKFIEKRDGGVKADPNNIFMTNGASTAIDMILQTLLADETCGVMIPIPQYPLYTASIALRKGNAVNYYLDEENGWSIDIDHLEESLANAKEGGINVRGFVLINPGNPTGQVLSREAMHEVVNFCSRNKLVLMADEVYQENVYDDNAEFVSAKRAAFETGLLERDAIELVSFHSTSKGLYGECGHRGGYMEVVGFDEKVVGHLYKLASSCLCPNMDGGSHGSRTRGRKRVI
jgi:aspartate/methionine/tyrosine aminotransferase